MISVTHCALRRRGCLWTSLLPSSSSHIFDADIAQYYPFFSVHNSISGKNWVSRTNQSLCDIIAWWRLRQQQTTVKSWPVVVVAAGVVVDDTVVVSADLWFDNNTAKTNKHDKTNISFIGVGDGGEGGTGGGHVPPKIRKEIFFGQLLCKIRAFFWKKIM